MTYKKFVFVHIFKTGGTTLKYNLRDRYGKRFLYDVTFRKERKHKRVVKLVDNTMIYDPPDYEKYDIILGHFTYEKYKHLNRINITMLRDPLKRFISHYSNMLKRRDESFEEFCEKTKDIYVHFTGGDLNNFDFVGLTEYYDLSMKKIQKIVGFDMSAKFVKNKTTQINKTKPSDKVKLTKKQIKYFKDKNKQDYELFNEVLSSFKEKK
jgi:hypothetical protein